MASNIAAKTPKRKRKETKAPKVDTRAETFKLYELGKTINEIANERKLATSTIEGHLAYYVENGALRVEDLVSKEKIQIIEPVVRELWEAPLSRIKDRLGPDITFGEIRLVTASIQYRKDKQ